jgi:ABC-type transport system involved in multi-copper enzyme maturation permease subunit
LIPFQIFRFFSQRKWRWLTVVAVQMLFSIMFLQVNYPQQLPITVWDFIVDNMSQQTNSMIIVPSLFIFLIVDLISEEINSNYIEYTIARSKSRISWFMSKISTLFTVSLFFPLVCMMIYFIVALLSGIAIGNQFSDHSLMYKSFPPTYVLTLMFVLFVFTLLALGMLILTMTMFIRNPAVSWITGAGLCILSYATFIRHEFREAFVFMPTTQLFLLVRLPNRLIDNIQYLPIRWSYIYDITLFIISVFLGILQIRKADLLKSK